MGFRQAVEKVVQWGSRFGCPEAEIDLGSIRVHGTVCDGASFDDGWDKVTDDDDRPLHPDSEQVRESLKRVGITLREIRDLRSAALYFRVEDRLKGYEEYDFKELGDSTKSQPEVLDEFIDQLYKARNHARRAGIKIDKDKLRNPIIVAIKKALSLLNQTNQWGPLKQLLEFAKNEKIDIGGDPDVKEAVSQLSHHLMADMEKRVASEKAGSFSCYSVIFTVNDVRDLCNYYKVPFDEEWAKKTATNATKLAIAVASQMSGEYSLSHLVNSCSSLSTPEDFAALQEETRKVATSMIQKQMKKAEFYSTNTKPIILGSETLVWSETEGKAWGIYGALDEIAKLRDHAQYTLDEKDEQQIRRLAIVSIDAFTRLAGVEKDRFEKRRLENRARELADEFGIGAEC